MTPPAKRSWTPGPQLELALFPIGEPEAPRLEVCTETLIALNSATRLVLAAAEGRLVLSDRTEHTLTEALAILSDHSPGGRLGHVVRRYLAAPWTPRSGTELVEELAFVLSLASKGQH